MGGFLGQMYWLIYRNVLLKIRYKQATFQELFIPLIFVANLATIRFTTQTDALEPITSSQLKSYDLVSDRFIPQFDNAIAFVPNTSELEAIATALASDLNVTASPPVIGYSSEEALVDDVVNKTMNISFAVVFSEDFPSNLTYKIRLPYGSVPLDYGLFIGGAKCYGTFPAYGLSNFDCPANSYLYSGFSVIQALVEHSIVKLVSGDGSLPPPDVSVRMFPKGQYNYPLDSLRITASIYIVMAYMPFTAVLMTFLVAEKEKKIKECMNIMGLNNAAFWLAWLAIYLVIVFVVAIIIAGYCKAITLFAAGSFFLIFLGLFLYGVSIVTMAFMLTPLFKKATSAGAAGSFVIILFVIPYIPIGVLGISAVGTAGTWALCIFSPVAVALLIDRAILFEQDMGGLQFSNLGASEFPPYACLVMLLVDLSLYLILAIYLEDVVPGEFGAKKSPFFCLSPSYWCGKQSKEVSDKTGLLRNGDSERSFPTDSNEDVEPVSQVLRERNGIKIRNMKKTFPGKDGQPPVKAVNGITLDIYEGQITCLLGHNGAGKSTLMNCLTGLTSPTEGEATIYGLDVRNGYDMGKIHTMTGVCLQENTIFDFLSPEEHLKIYAGLKGVAKDEIPKMVEEVLELTDLNTQSATLAKDLSGGQKRKLCVGMAIIGNPKILFLDEPSSGMDPYSRRKMWSLLKKQREGRVTLFTTHFMDEADILADRKAIVSKGQLRCSGSSLFLKNKFGLGYHLSMVVESQCERDEITTLIQTHVPEAKVSRSHGMELSYRLPLKDVSAFAAMFKSLEQGSGGAGEQTTAQALGIQSYGVSMTTLEEVFLKIGEEAEMDEVDAASRQPINGMSIEDSGSSAGPSVTVDLNQSPLDSTILATKPIQVTRMDQMKRLSYVVMLIAIRRPATYVLRLVFPILFMVGGGLVATLVKFGGDGPSDTPAPLWFTPDMYLSAASMPDLATSTELLYQDSLPNVQDISDILSEFGRLDVAVNATANLSALYDVRPHNAAVDLMDYGTTGSASQYTAYYNDTAQHSLPVILSMMSSALLGLYANGSDPPVIAAASHPFPKPDALPTYSISSGIIFVYLFGLGVTFALLGFPVDRVKERAEKIKAQLRISGIDTLSYWGSVFIVDYAQMLLVALIGLIVILAIQVPALVTGGAIFCFLWTVVFYMPVAILSSYCVGFIFDKYETAQGYSSFFFIHIPIIMFLPTMFLDIYGMQIAAGAVHLVCCAIYPIYSIFGAMYFIIKVYDKALIFGQADDLVFADYFSPDAFIWPTILIIMISNLYVGFFVRYLEVVKTGGNKRDACPCLKSKRVGAAKKNDDLADEEDDDVKAERVRVDEIFQHDETCAVAIQELRREFVKRTNDGCCSPEGTDTTKVAVRNLSLTVKTGEVLGLLGPNGAGKTTTMNVVTADFEPTRGQVRVGGYDVTSALSSAYQAMGYCPQINPLWEDITMREHLEAYAAFKGIHRDDRRQIADNYMSAIGVMEHADKRAKALSGGTKRKLCFALSMLGDPQIVLLDEPSTGMDPISKRFLWNTITSSFVNKKGAILTTHSMEEADAVCSRVGIMTSGQLRCIGTTQHLKDKYGGGYMLEVKLNPGAYYYLADQTNTSIMDVLDEKMEALHAHITDFIPNAEVSESFSERITYKIPRDGVVSLSSVFSFLEQGKEDYGIEEYSFSQTTLEQVFIEFAKGQDDDHVQEGTDAVEVVDPERPSSRRSRRSGPKPQISVEG